MRTDWAWLTFHGLGMVLALGAATFWPRGGQAAVLVPIGNQDLIGTLAWAKRETAPLLELDTARGRIVARIADDRTMLSALGAGIVPLAVRARDCRPARAVPPTNLEAEATR